MFVVLVVLFVCWVFVCFFVFLFWCLFVRLFLICWGFFMHKNSSVLGMPRAFSPTVQKEVVRETNSLFNCQLSSVTYRRGPSKDGRELGIEEGGG